MASISLTHRCWSILLFEDPLSKILLVKIRVSVGQTTQSGFRSIPMETALVRLLLTDFHFGYFIDELNPITSFKRTFPRCSYAQLSYTSCSVGHQ